MKEPTCQTELPPEVEAIGKIHFEGNIIPASWFQNLTYQTPGGQTKPHLEAILILSDIVYWYRPSEVRDENTGKVLGYRKKFKSDLLQRSNQSLAEQFGLSKKQVQRALHYLKEQGLVEVEFRTITTDSGMVLPNVAFIRPFPDRIRDITYRTHPYTSSRGMDKSVQVSGQNRTDITEIPSEDSSKISLSSERENASLPPEVTAWYTAQGLQKHLSSDPDLLRSAWRSCRADEGSEGYPGHEVRVKAVLKGTFSVPEEPEEEKTGPVKVYRIPSVEEL